MNAIVKTEASQMPSLQMSEAELMSVLRSSLYPGAADDSIKMVISYCKASGLDVMQKPVHIVPMSVSTGKKDDKGWDIKENRDVIMPGIGLYRTQASRTGQYLGASEPEFGPMKKMGFKEKRTSYNNGQKSEAWVDVEFEYPEWCRVVVKRLLPGGMVGEFVAKEYWLENYATKGKEGAPNSMWFKRPMGQIAKCTKAQALREGFPELGAQPTADEMEGKSLHDDAINVQAHRVPDEPAPMPAYSDEAFAENFPRWESAMLVGRLTAEDAISRASTVGTLSQAQIDTINSVPSGAAA